VANSESEISAKFLGRLLGLSIQRVGQLAKEGVIHKLENGRYPPEAVAEYIRWRYEQSGGVAGDEDWSDLLEKEKYREKKRQNDLEEQLVAPISILTEVLERGVAAMVPILDTLPLMVKRNWPEVTGDQVTLVKKAVAECRNILAELEITFED
jgi:phage terminase Nu1 subunit (DNA packaging protein)